MTPRAANKVFPRIDKHIYSRENGWAINAITALYQATGDVQYLNEAVAAANWIIANRSLENGGFSHDTKDVSGPYLNDTLAMTRAFVNLYASTGDRAWLNRASGALTFIASHFKNSEGAGFLTASVPTDHAYKPHPERDENLVLAKVANLAYQYTGDEAIQTISQDAMKFPVTPEIAKEYTAAGTLLADSELTAQPTHLTIVGHKDDAASLALFRSALQFPSGYRRVEWWDKREGTLPRGDVEYPELDTPAAFVCTERSCSSPITDPAKLLLKAAALSK